MKFAVFTMIDDEWARGLTDITVFDSEEDALRWQASILKDAGELEVSAIDDIETIRDAISGWQEGVGALTFFHAYPATMHERRS